MVKEMLYHILKNKLSVFFLIISILLPITNNSFGATINGTLKIDNDKLSSLWDEIENKIWGSSKLKRNWKIANGIIPIRPNEFNPNEQIGIALFPKSGKAATVSLPTVTTDIINLHLEPEVILITPNTEVRFRNKETFIHSLYSPDFRDFSPLIQQNKEIRHFRFDSPGIFALRDKIYPHIVGWLVVLETPFVTNPQKNEAGQYEFRFSDIAIGEYEIKIFFGGQWISKIPVNIEKENQELKLEINVPSNEDESNNNKNTKSKEIKSKVEKNIDKNIDKNISNTR